jgi:predicted transcriptional regulator
MGWTHYWQRKTELPIEAFARAAEDCAKVMELINVPLGGLDGKGKPIFEKDHIVFNGASRTGCEPFEVARIEFDRRGRRIVLSACKTERAPYDICVQVALIAFKHHLDDTIAVSSDGGNDDWEEARRICQEGLGYGINFELEKLPNAM